MSLTAQWVYILTVGPPVFAFATYLKLRLRYM
jgi:hypothetical protein